MPPGVLIGTDSGARNCEPGKADPSTPLRREASPLGRSAQDDKFGTFRRRGRPLDAPPHHAVGAIIDRPPFPARHHPSKMQNARCKMQNVCVSQIAICDIPILLSIISYVFPII